MSEWVSLDVIDGVGPVAVKRRRSPEEERLLDHEATVLARLELPGVVRLVERRHGSDAALVTHFVGTHSLATAPTPDLADTIAIVGALASTVAELHRLGVRHGAIDASHVLLGPGGRPVLCGFSRATEPGDPPENPPTAADDVAAIGRLMTVLVADHDELEPIPVRRSIRRGEWSGYRPRALLTLADHCQADEPAARPTAAVLAATIGELAEPTASPASSRLAAGRRRLGRAVTGLGVRARERVGGMPRRIDGRLTAVLGLSVVGLVAAVIGWSSWRSSTPADAAGTRPIAAAATGGTAPAVPTPGAAAPANSPSSTPSPGRDCRGSPSPGVDTDGDGCADGVAVVDGHRVTVGEASFVLGVPGDRVLVGDWDCDGLATGVLVRADPPGLWHFPTWTGADDVLAAELVHDEVLPDTVSRRTDPRGCHELIADLEGPGGPETLVIPA